MEAIIIFCVIALPVICLIHTFLMIQRRLIWPIRNRNWEISVAIITNLTIICSLGLASGHQNLSESINCFIFTFIFWEASIFLNAALFMRHICVYLNFGYNDRICGDSLDNHEDDDILSRKEPSYKQYHRHIMNFMLKRRLNLFVPLMICGLITGIPLLVYLLFNADSFTYAVEDSRCNWDVLVNINIPMFLVYALICPSVIWSIRNRRENLGIIRELVLLDSSIVLWLVWILIGSNILREYSLITVYVFFIPALVITCIVSTQVLYASFNRNRLLETKASAINGDKELASWLNDEKKRELFKEFLMGEFCAESIFFYEAVKQYQIDVLTRQALKIYDNFVDDNSPYCINVSHFAREAVKEHIEADSIDETLFDGCFQEILKLMRFDPFSRFKMTEVYQLSLIEAFE